MMNSLVLSVAIVAATFTEATHEGPLSYRQAHERAMATRQPMLVLVGAEWCPACRVMKDDVLPRMQRNGQLKDVLFTIVDVDQQPKLSSSLTHSSTIPQLVLYAPKQDGWYRIQLQGSQSPERIVSMIRSGLELQHVEKIAAKSATPSDSNPTVGDE